MISKLGVLLLVVGVLIGVGAYASPQLAILTLNNQDTALSVVSGVPISTSVSAPTGLNPSETISATFMTPETELYSLAPSISGAAGSLTVAGASITPAISTSTYYESISPRGYEARITLTASFTPASAQLGQSLPFVWTASFTATGQLSSGASGATYYSGSVTTYGEYTPPLTDVGEFGISAPGYAFQYITPTTNLTMQFSSYPQSITFYYVENKGSTLGASQIYITVNGAKLVLWSQSPGGTTTTVNGYNAYEVQDSLNAGQYTINGYVTNASSGSAVQLMSIGMGLPTVGPVISSLTLGQEVSMAFGAILAVVGLALIVRRLV